MTEPRILIYDLESAPNLGYCWGKWDQNIIQMYQEWYLLTASWRWLGEKKTHVVGLDDFEDYKPGEPDDYNLVKVLHDLFDEADIAVTHNGNTFDQPKARSRMIHWEMEPPSPFKEIDTLKVSRRTFGFTTNTLEDICKRLDIGDKGKPGFGVWLGCMNGDPDAWAKMKKYNKQDVVLLEKLYLRLRPWIQSHPNVGLFNDFPNGCPRCGVTGQMQARGWTVAQTTKRQRYQCKSCGGWCSGRAIIKTDVEFVP